MHALVIDDSRALRRILGRMLEQLRFAVTEAANGRVRLKTLRTGPRPQIVLVDWNMPHMNGLKFVRAVRQNPTYAEPPLMMVTTETEMQQMTLALEAGANEYVMKPFSEACIAEKLALLGVLPAAAAS